MCCSLIRRIEHGWQSEPPENVGILQRTSSVRFRMTSARERASERIGAVAYSSGFSEVGGDAKRAGGGGGESGSDLAGVECARVATILAVAVLLIWQLRS